MALKRDGEHEQVRGRAGSAVFVSQNLSGCPDSFFDLRRGSLSPLGVARSDDDRLSRPDPL
jgi:hypothetical protein